MAALAQLCELCSAWVLGAKRVPFRGKERLEHVHSVILDIDTRLGKLRVVMGDDNFLNSVETMKGRLQKTFKFQRIAAHEEALAQVLAQPHVPSAKVSQRGVDVAPMVAGKHQFGKLFNKGNNIALLLCECAVRYSDYPIAQRPITEGAGIKNLKDWIRKDEIKRNPTNKDEAAKYFKPLFTRYEDYTFQTVR